MRSILRLAVAASVALMWVGLARAAEDDVNALIDNAIKAKGGADKIAKVKALVMKSKGKYYGMGEKGLDYTEVATFELPDKARVEIQSEAEGMKLAFIEVFDGTKGWNSMNGKTDEMTKDQLAEMKEGMYAHRLGMLYTLKEKGYKITPLPGDVKVGDKAAVGIKVSSEGHRDVNLMFDKKTHLLLKIETQVKDLNDPTVKEPKEVTQELFFDDYKDIDGIPQPRKLVILRAGKKFVEAEITDFKMPEKIDAKMFEKP